MITACMLTAVFWFGLQEPEFHSWTDQSGSYSVEAAMKVLATDKLEADVVLTRKSDNESLTVPMAKLSKESQRLAKRLRKQARRLRDQMKKDAAEPTKLPGQPQKKIAAGSVWNWRGPKQNGISDENGLLNQWEGNGPELLWSAGGLGNAMSSLALQDDRLFTMGNIDGTEYLIAVNRSDGSEVWKARVGNGGESNSTPTVDGEFVFGLGRDGDLVCVETESGREVWRKSYTQDFGGKMMSQWGYSESPLVDGDRVICTPGGATAMMVALDRKTGKTIWKTSMTPGGNRGTDGAGYASIVISNGGGTKQYITVVGRGLISVAAKDGKPLWHYERIANGTANVPTPIVDGDFVLCSTGYDDGGTALLRLGKSNRGVGYREVYYLSANQLQNHHGGMIKIGNYVYMGEGHNKGFPTCFEFSTGRRTWPKQRGAGSGSAAIVAADGHLYFRYENGIMALIEANPSEYRLKGKFTIATCIKQSWAHPVVYDGNLYLRDQDQLHCYRIKAR